MKISDYDDHPSIIASNKTSKRIKEQQEIAESAIAKKVEGLIEGIATQNPELKNLKINIDIRDLESTSKINIQLINNDHFDIKNSPISTIQMAFDQTGLTPEFNSESLKVVERGIENSKTETYKILNEEILKSLNDNRDKLAEDLEVHHELAQEASKEFEWRRQQGISLMEIGDRYLEGAFNKIKNRFNKDRMDGYNIELASREEDSRFFDITRLENEVENISLRQFDEKVKQDTQKKNTNDTVNIDFNADIQVPEKPEAKASQKMKTSIKP